MFDHQYTLAQIIGEAHCLMFTTLKCFNNNIQRTCILTREETIFG